MNQQDRESFQHTINVMADVAEYVKKNTGLALSESQQTNKALQNAIVNLPEKLSNKVKNELKESVQQETTKLFDTLDRAIQAARHAEEAYQKSAKHLTLRISLFVLGTISALLLILGGSLWVMYEIDKMYVQFPIKEFQCNGNTGNIQTCITYKGQTFVMPKN